MPARPDDLGAEWTALIPRQDDALGQDQIGMISTRSKGENNSRPGLAIRAKLLRRREIMMILMAARRANGTRGVAANIQNTTMSLRYSPSGRC